MYPPDAFIAAMLALAIAVGTPLAIVIVVARMVVLPSVRVPAPASMLASPQAMPAPMLSVKP